MNETLYMILKVVTSVSSLCIYVSPIPSMRRILKAKSSGEMQLIPLVGLFINCHLWMLYGLFTGNIFPMVFTFLIGELLAVIYVSIFIKFTSDRVYVQKICLAGALSTGLLTLYAVLAWAGLTGQSTADTGVVLGYIGLVSLIAFYASPLMKMRTVDN